MNDIEAAPASRRWLRPLRPRDTDEEHRASTPLELFFDLCFVVAVAQAPTASSTSSPTATRRRRWSATGLVFFAIWWAWMNFTWFASAYDTDDVAYRLAAFVQIAGCCILAAGVPRAFEDQDFGVVTLGYAVMRLAHGRPVAAGGRTTIPRAGAPTSGTPSGSRRAGRLGRSLAVPDAWAWPTFFVLVVAELAYPSGPSGRTHHVASPPHRPGTG